VIEPVPDPVECPRCGVEIDADANRCGACGAWAPGNPGTASSLVRMDRARVFVRELEAAKDEIETWVSDGPGSEPRFAGARLSAATALARMTLAGKLLDEIGYFDGRGRPRPAAVTLESANNAFLMHLEKLGLTPTGAAKLAQKPTATDATDYLHRVAREAEADRRRARAKDAKANDHDDDEETP
jgi:hypothetical protein